MLITTTPAIADREIAQTIGLVRGSAVRASHLGRDIWAFMKNLVGGEIDDYTKLMAEAREQAIDRMVAEARAQGADAVVGLRFANSTIASGAAEVLAYGTAVRLAQR
ncbi:YbjQ family protein [Engelhardtia mirabilis]|uniref:UPF0145 protein Pla133_31920 n=1 Tax=Engelhardtia mirabilis TaxID=2528011 RepID=A0A518BM90_9BACT|nr:hypothetical protein Pla133_31920 [Planctomycetes bacterium Pla133]QDV02424.1 hypothetical protein Pla86_31910 [Planctomycetes bacterium Pla86]